MPRWNERAKGFKKMEFVARYGHD